MLGQLVGDKVDPFSAKAAIRGKLKISALFNIDFWQDAARVGPEGERSETWLEVAILIAFLWVALSGRYLWQIL